MTQEIPFTFPLDSWSRGPAQRLPAARLEWSLDAIARPNGRGAAGPRSQVAGLRCPLPALLEVVGCRDRRERS
jgi:hypothetical protein